MSDIENADLVRRRAERLSTLLARTDVAPRTLSFPAGRLAARTSRRAARRWRIAAGIVLLIAGAAGVTPVRAWIVARARAAWLRIAGADVAPPVSPPASRAPMGTVSFPAPDPLTIRVAGRQASGSLVIESSAGPAASVEITGEPDAAELVVVPDGARIVNRPASGAGYTVRVPAGVSRVVVIIGREPPRVLAPSAGRVLVDLSVRSGARRAFD